MNDERTTHEGPVEDGNGDGSPRSEAASEHMEAAPLKDDTPSGGEVAEQAPSTPERILAQAGPLGELTDRIRTLRNEIRELVRERGLHRESLRRIQADLKAERAIKLPKVENRAQKPLIDSTEDTTAAQSTAPAEDDAPQADAADYSKENTDHTQKTDHQGEHLQQEESNAHIDKRPRLEVDDTQKKRTRNIFGHLMGHLKKAKARLDEEKDSRQAEMHLKTAQRVEEKLKSEREALREAKLKALKDEEASIKERLRKLQWDLDVKETECLKCQLELHYQYMQNFISTKAQPTIFWVPNIHTDRTRQLQAETSSQIEKKIRSISEQLKPVSFEN